MESTLRSGEAVLPLLPSSGYFFDVVFRYEADFSVKAALEPAGLQRWTDCKHQTERNPINIDNKKELLDRIRNIKDLLLLYSVDGGLLPCRKKQLKNPTWQQ
jgi:hypothetical protein